MNSRKTIRYRRMRAGTGKRNGVIDAIKAFFTHFFSSDARKKPAGMPSVIKGLRIGLFVLCGAFALVTCLMVGTQWREGETAGKNADMLLGASGINPADETSDLNSVSADAQNKEDANGAYSADLKGYSVIARLDIDALDLHLPVLSETNDKALTASVCYYTGPAPGGEGNMVVTGHNYSSGQHFGKLDKLKINDTVLVTDTNNSTYTYEVYEMDHIKPDNAQALDDTEYNCELTLLTCEENGNGRLLVRCRELGNG